MSGQLWADVAFGVAAAATVGVLCATLRRMERMWVDRLTELEARVDELEDAAGDDGPTL